MRDFCVANNNNTKMAELKFEAPLAQSEEADEWGPVDFQSSLPQSQTNPIDSLSYLNNLKENMLVIDNNNTIDNLKANAANITNNNNNINKLLTKDNIDNFNEGSSFSGSLEDLVNTFDEKITKCFGNYEQSVEELAPVQVRSQEEIMNECQ
jgi:FEZ-like protein